MVFSQSGRFSGPGSTSDVATSFAHSRGRRLLGTTDINRPAALEQGKDE
jgi:hypothetical protein